MADKTAITVNVENHAGETAGVTIESGSYSHSASIPGHGAVTFHLPGPGSYEVSANYAGSPPTRVSSPIPIPGDGRIVVDKGGVKWG